uniref:Uncharacterized protein n=1 Tax=Arundo donax TaxID=35708 RepID=A0A0A9BAQ4_ARUDO
MSHLSELTKSRDQKSE